MLEVFQYKHEQLINIIKSRVGSLDVFDESAIVMCSRAISGNGGDARKALETCKRAIDIHTNPDTKVSMKDMSIALKQIQSIQAKGIIEQLSFYHKILLAAILQAIKIGQKSTVQIREVFDRATKIAKQINQQSIPNYQLTIIASQLLALNLIKSTKSGPINATCSVSLQTFDQELIFYLSKTEELKPFLPTLEISYE